MHMQRLTLPLSIASLICCYNAAALAASGTAPLPLSGALQEFKLKPNVNVEGLAGNATAAKGEALLPLYGDQKRVLFGIAEGNAQLNHSDWYAGVGLGYRQVIHNLIYGGYIIADYNTSDASNHFWLANPGFEIMGEKWDTNINIYLPAGSSKKSNTRYGWASDFGNYNYLTHTGHSQYDRHAERSDFEVIGRGADFKIGRTIPGLEKVKGYVGAYYFDTKEAGHVRGGLAKITYELNNYLALSATDTYDNKNHNRIMGGIRLTLGAYDKREQENFGISGRLMERIDRGYGSTLVPIIAKNGVVQALGKQELQYDNLWFFYPTDNTANSVNLSNGDGTFERPFYGLTPANYQTTWDNRNIGHLTPNPILYLANGTYPLTSFTGYDGRPSCFQLPEEWSMIGWENNFTTLAAGDNRPLLIGGIDLWYNNANPSKNNLLRALALQLPSGATVNDWYQGSMRINNAANVILDKVSVTANVTSNSNEDVLFSGITAYNSNLNLSDTDTHFVINIEPNSSLFSIRGIYASKSSLNFASGKNTLKVEALVNDNSRNVTFLLNGIYSLNSQIYFNNGTNDISAISSGKIANSSTFFVSTRGLYLINSNMKINGGNNVFVAKNTLTGIDNLIAAASALEAASHSFAELNGGKNYFSAENNATANNGLQLRSFAVSQNSNNVERGSIDVNGGTNSFMVNNIVNAGNGATIEAATIAINKNFSFNLNGGHNLFSLTNSATVHDNATINLSGIAAKTNSDVAATINSGVNIFAIKNHTLGSDKDIVNVIGVDARDRATAKITQGVNIFNLTSYGALQTNGTLNVMGITASTGATIDLYGGTNVVNMGIFGDAKIERISGIYADASALLKADGNQVTNLSDILRKITTLHYNKNGSYTEKYKVLWDGVGSIEWL